MGKVIFWLVLVFGALFALRLYNSAKARARGEQARQEAARKTTEPATMVRCASCGVFLPKSDALPAPGGYRCGEPGCSGRR
jgi:uncharacterized protein